MEQHKSLQVYKFYISILGNLDIDYKNILVHSYPFLYLADIISTAGSKDKLGFIKFFIHNNLHTTEDT